MKKRPEVILLTGNIGCGKTTLAKEYVKKGYIIIARDALRYGIGAGQYIFNPDLETSIWLTEMDMFINFLDIGVNIVVDEIGINKKMRKRYISIIKECYPNYKIISIELPKFTRVKSVNRRMIDPHGTPDRTVWEGVWDKFDAQYQKPTKKEGFYELIRLKEIK